MSNKLLKTFSTNLHYSSNNIKVDTKNSTKIIAKRGFTLLEILAVLAIISILAAAFVPKLSNYINEAKKVDVLNEAKDVAIAFQNARAKNSSLNPSTVLISNLESYTDLISIEDIEKIDHSKSVQDCINILDTEHFNFTISDGKLGTIVPIPD